MVVRRAVSLGLELLCGARGGGLDFASRRRPGPARPPKQQQSQNAHHPTTSPVCRGWRPQCCRDSLLAGDSSRQSCARGRLRQHTARPSHCFCSLRFSAAASGLVSKRRSRDAARIFRLPESVSVAARVEGGRGRAGGRAEAPAGAARGRPSPRQRRALGRAVGVAARSGGAASGCRSLWPGIAP